MADARSLADHVTDFSNVLTKSQIEDMAGVDELEVVKEVQVCVWLKCRLIKGHRRLGLC